ncbi:MAG: class I adenylate-forming enzyme family protein [Streptosporangiaceae bacterium]
MSDATFDALLAQAARHGRHVAVIDGHRRIPLARLDREATILAAALAAQGTRPGDRVAVAMTSGADALACFFAVLRAGAAAVLVSPQAPEAVLRRILTAAKASALIADAAAGAAQDAITSVLRHDHGAAEARTATISASFTSATITSATSPPSPPASGPGPGGVAAIFCTTGTTGEPRTVLHTHGGLVASVRALDAAHRSYFRGAPPDVAARLLRMAWRYRGRLRSAVGRQTWLTPMPFHTIGGLRFMTQAVLSGHRLVVMPRFHPRALIETVGEHRVSVLALTPTMLEAVLAVRSVAGADLSSLLVVGLGSAPASAGLISRAEQVLGCPVLNGYGSTETAGGILATRIGDAGDGSVGYPLPGAEVKVVDDAGNPVAPGTVGELLCRTGSLMAGYGDLPAPPPRGWHRTGDLALVDGRGAVHIVGRSRDLIIRGGTKIVPVSVENALLEDPAVAAASVVGIADPLAGERIVAFVVARAGGDLRPADVLAGCRARLAAQEMPDHLFVVPDLPVAESGEVRKVELRSAASRLLTRARPQEENAVEVHRR